ncbi:transcriptional regulator [Capsulimonas corticalis]|uniref:Transcriptional regulator n=1 Tax=Capsulimonas corticalis TaxID=2219043 RepID=A0A402D393_9BACT|nr:metal-sensitive transcriptional regulator [Capsulimonas corticalis]BDI28567.1 transcriptional regulator [Capsulimonas corticalis]
MQQEARQKIQNRLKRISGQVAGVQRMVEEDRYCVDILTQVAAIRSALDAVGVAMLTSHLETCVLGHGAKTEHECAKQMTQTELLEEVRVSLERFLK